MNRGLLYIVIAIVLGLAMTLVPTSLFLVNADRYRKAMPCFAGIEDFVPPLLDLEQNHVETVSPREVEILGVSFVVASIVYVLFKRKTQSHDYIWPAIRPY
jgi:hypothetical protein